MWEIHNKDQLVTVLLSALLGAVFCIFYELLKSFRKTFLKKATAIFVCDIVFWLFSAAVTFIWLLARTGGEIRLYVLLSLLAGFMIFRFTVAQIFLFAFEKTLFLISVCVSFFAGISYKISKFLSHVFSILLVKIISMCKVIKKLLKNATKVLYNKSNI